MKKFMVFVAAILILSLAISSCNNPAVSSKQGESSRAVSVVSETSSSNETSTTESGKGNESVDWTGDYKYGYELFDDNSDFQFGVSYSLKIYENNGINHGTLTAGGRGIDQELTVYFEGIGNRIDAYFLEQNPEKLPPVNFQEGEKLFSLVQKDSKIYTTLHAYSIDIFPQGEEVIAFEKDE